MESRDSGSERSTPEDVVVDSFRPEDAEGIVRLFRAVYGEHYPIRLFYDPGAVTEANREGRYYSIVARTVSGDVVGVTHLYRSTPCDAIYEHGVGLVLKAYRKSGITGKLHDYLYNDFVPRQPHIEEIFGEAVCNHPYMQKAVAAFGFSETAIEVALMPAEAYTREKSAPGRVATLSVFRSFRPRPHRVFLPTVYEDVLNRIYGRLDDSRDLARSVDPFPAGRVSRATMTVFDFAGVARIAVPVSGADLGRRLADLEREAADKGCVVFQAWLNLTEPWAGASVEALREAGYFFGGPLPRWFDGDGFLMQKILCPPDFESIVLESGFSRELLAFIREDRERVA